MWKKPLLSILFILSISFVRGQLLVTTFIDPCTKEISYFNIPVQGSTVIFFYGRQRSFSASDVSNGSFSTWINQAYSDYRKISPCNIQQTGIIRNQINSQVIGNIIGGIIGSLNSSITQSSQLNSITNSASTSLTTTGKSPAENSIPGKSPTSSSSGNEKTGNSQDQGTKNSNTGSASQKGEGSKPQAGSRSSTAAKNEKGTDTQEKSGNTNTSSVSEKDAGSSQEQASTEMNIETKNEKSGESSSKSKRTNRSSGKSNPLIVSSDLTSAQNLDKSFTGIINLGLSQSSMTGTSSWGLTSMIWFNLKQFALSGRYTTMHMNKQGNLKYIQNFNLTTVYSYGSLLCFVGYSGILNFDKSGVAGFNISGTATKTPDDRNLFISPSITGFYTRPFIVNKKLTISPEIYVISTPIIYTSIDKITVTDRTFSGFIGSGFDYQLTKRFRFNVNYKANLSTNPEFPVLSFFLIGSKVNL